MARSEEEEYSSVSVIDLQDFSTQSSEKLLEACESLGCFRVVNHGIPLRLMSEMKSVVRHLLDLPADTKRRNTDTIAGSGYMGPSPTNPLYEALGLYDVDDTGAVDAFCDQLDAKPHHRETIKSYAREMHDLAMEIAHKITKSLGIDRGDVCSGWPIQFRINKYSFTEESVGTQGVQLHTDSTFLTILQEDECVGGLEVMEENNGNFIPIQPSPGSLLVNLGDIAKAWSNGRLCNVKHRVQCKEAATRVSIAVFLLGPKENLVEAPPELVDADHPRLYLPFTYGDYRKHRVSGALHVGEALDLYTMN